MKALLLVFFGLKQKGILLSIVISAVQKAMLLMLS